MSRLCVGTCEIRIPTFRRPNLLRRALTSVLQQTYTDWRCVVLDDCRESTGRLIVDEIRDTRIEYSRNPQQLGALGNIDKAFQRGPMLGGQYAFVLEDDNYLIPRHIEKAIHIVGTENVSVVFCNQFCETAEFSDEPGRITGIRTLDWMYEPGVHEPDELLPSLLFSHGFSNGAAFWRTDCRSNFQIGRATLSTGVQESLRLLQLKDPVYVSLEATSVWRGREPVGAASGRRFGFKNLVRTAKNRVDRAIVEMERIDYQCEVLKRVGTDAVAKYIADNKIPDFLNYRSERIRSIERSMLLCGYSPRLQSTPLVDRMTCMVLGFMARRLVSRRDDKGPPAHS
jgi:glycosyltransferase involved in cell wall biosynthesis